MQQLIYCSTAHSDTSFEMIEAILNIAKSRNKEFDVSGMLIFNGTYFLQCIEGPKEQIETLYNNIFKDDRHFNIKKLDQKKIEKRDFGNWSMGYYNSTNQINEFIKHNDFDPYNISFEEAKKLLEKFSKGLV